MWPSEKKRKSWKRRELEQTRNNQSYNIITSFIRNEKDVIVLNLFYSFPCTNMKTSNAVSVHSAHTSTYEESSECIHSLAQKSEKVWRHSQNSYIWTVQQDPEVSATIQKSVFVFSHPPTVFLIFHTLPTGHTTFWCDADNYNVTGTIFLSFWFMSVAN